MHASSSKPMVPLTSQGPCATAVAMLGLRPPASSSFVYPIISSCTIPTASLTRSVVFSLRTFRLPLGVQKGIMEFLHEFATIHSLSERA